MSPQIGGGRKRSAAEDETMPFPHLNPSETNQDFMYGANFDFNVSPPKTQKNSSGKTFEEEYAMKRQKNNAAVNKTRQKKRQEELSTQMRVKELRHENEKLERRLETMRRELELLKEMVIACSTGKKNLSMTTGCESTT